MSTQGRSRDEEYDHGAWESNVDDVIQPNSDRFGYPHTAHTFGRWSSIDRAEVHENYRYRESLFDTVSGILAVSVCMLPFVGVILLALVVMIGPSIPGFERLLSILDSEEKMLLALYIVSLTITLWMWRHDAQRDRVI